MIPDTHFLLVRFININNLVPVFDFYVYFILTVDQAYLEDEVNYIPQTQANGKEEVEKVSLLRQRFKGTQTVPWWLIAVF